ncbi:hypothetical protein ACWOFR_08490 [Carnobacterium gallinarum]|uniref:hypothetical protein n=1 Tax=Carnobacterium gallinarum TaxID=2749 RepID=UPI00054F4FEB|nr:hypothetical protein [Carnobacterium gallinarum]
MISTKKIEQKAKIVTLLILLVSIFTITSTILFKFSASASLIIYGLVCLLILGIYLLNIYKNKGKSERLIYLFAFLIIFIFALNSIKNFTN